MMMQTIILCWINFKSFPQRFFGAIISIFSIACVAAVMLGVLTLTKGMMNTMARTGLDNTLLVMRAGASSELQSVMFPMEINILADHQQIKRDSKGKSIYSAEMFVGTQFKGLKGQAINENSNKQQSLALRGISQQTYLFRANFSLVEGEKFTQGLKQVIVGRAVVRRNP